MAFAYFKISIIGADGRASKPVRVKADVDDPCVGDKLRVAGAWHEVVDVLHMINEQQRPRVADAVVVCAPLLSPPPWLDDIEGDGPCAEASASRDLSMGSARVLEFVPPPGDGALASLPTIDSEPPMRLPDPFMRPTVQRHVRVSAIATAQTDPTVANVPAEVADAMGQAFVVAPEAETSAVLTLRELAPLVMERATGIHQRQTAMQPRRQSAVPTVVTHSPQRRLSIRRKRWRFAGALVGGAAAVVIGALVVATATRSDRAGGNESALAMEARPERPALAEAPDLAAATATPVIAKEATATTERLQIRDQRDQGGR